MPQERLVAYAPDGIQRFALDGDDLVIGSGRDCDIRLRPQHVAPHHARLRRRKGRLEIEALSEKAALEVNGRPVKRARVDSLDEIRLGDVTLILDDIDWESRGSTTVEPEVQPGAVADRSRPSMLGMVAEVSDWVVGDYSSNRSLESILISLLRRLGGGIVFLFMAADGKNDFAVKFVVSTEASWIGRGEELLAAIEAVESEAPSDEPGAEIELEKGLDDEPTSVYSTQIHALDRDYRILGAFPGLKRERRLRAMGEQWSREFDANTLIVLRKAAIGFDARPGAANIKAPLLYVLSRSDALFPPEIAPETIAMLKDARVDATYVEIDTEYGHRGPSVDWQKWESALKIFIDTHCG